MWANQVACESTGDKSIIQWTPLPPVIVSGGNQNLERTLNCRVESVIILFLPAMYHASVVPPTLFPPGDSSKESPLGGGAF